MSFPASFLDELRARVPLASVVGRRVKLTRKGRKHSGLCPFHNEKSPSFTVNEDKGFFHCFGCGAHGDVIAFEMRAGSLSFIEAVETLAAEAGLEIPRATPEERAQDQRRASLHQALEAACRWYEAQLQSPAGAEGLAYLRGRGLDDETIARWRLGWAPAAGQALQRGLGSAVYPESLLIEAGLVRPSQDGPARDLFRGRVLFPITDGRGQVVAFGGRLIAGEGPKYLNSPETPLWDKGATLYGLAQARAAATDAGRVIVVEGYLDVIALHRAGLPLAVAPLGTALTERHLEAAWRVAPEILVCLDGDAAGQAAMERTARRALPLLAPDRSLRFATGLPRRHDPDSLLRQHGPEALRRALAGSRSAVEWLWGLALRGAPPDTPERLAAFERTLASLAATIAHPGLRRAVLDHWRERLRRAYRPAPPALLVGRSRRKFAPRPGHGSIAEEWTTARAEAEAGKVRPWLADNGINPEALWQHLGGLGLSRAILALGRAAAGQDWPDAPRPTLWHPAEAGVSVLLIPVWAEGPGSALLDLVAWNPRTDEIASRTGHAAILGEDVVAEALAHEADGLTCPVAVADGPRDWLRDRAADRDSVFMIDWGRAWAALGPLSTLVAASIELGERLDKHVRPPRLRRPRIQVTAEAVQGAA